MVYKAGGLVLLLLVILCVLLASVLALEWFNPPTVNPPELSAAPDQQAPGLAIGSQGKLETPPLSEYSEIVERPLFMSSRRPQAESEETVEPEAPEQDTAFTLLGVLITPEKSTALLQIDESGGTARVALGESVQGWKLESAHADSVTLSKRETTLNLPLVRNRPLTVNEIRERRRQARKIPTAEELEALKKAAAAGAAPVDVPEGDTGEERQE